MLEAENLQQNTPEWLEFRKKYIGASDTPIIMGVSPYSTPYQLWQRKLGLLPDQGMTGAMQRGRDLEPIALKAFEEEHNLFMVPQVYVSKEFPWLMASIDGISLDGKKAVEIKCPGREAHEMALAGKIPEKYIYQLQHQMLVLNLQSMIYFSFDGQNGVSLVVQRDPALIDLLVFHTKKFWLSIINKESPELNERDYEKKTDKNWIDLASRWKQIRKTIKELENEEESIRGSLIHLASKQNAEGGGIRVQASYRQGRVDYNKIPELQGVDLEQYRKATIQTFCIREVE